MRTVAFVVALVACVHAGVWALLHRQHVVPSIDGQLASVSYNASWLGKDTDDPTPLTPEQQRQIADQIRADLKAISPYTRTIRTYTSTRGMELVPGIANEFGLKVTLGIWLNDKGFASRRLADGAVVPSRNETEIRNAIALARRYSNVNAIVVGNETTLRRDLACDRRMVQDYAPQAAGAGGRSLTAEERELACQKAMAGLQKTAQDRHDELVRESDRTVGAKPVKTVAVKTADDIFEELKAEKNVDELIRIIKDVKRQSPVPVTTGETWDIWLDHPKLASSVDYIAAHILPYWDKTPYQRATDHTIAIYEKLRRAHPGKRIVIAEFGWPSAGYNINDASPGRVEQATVIRDFIARAEAYGIDYNVIEAFDQTWKVNEGSVGAYWGLFDASRETKFAWSGPVSHPDYWRMAGLAALLGLLLSLAILSKPRVTTAEAVVLAAAANVVGAWFAVVFAFWKGHYFVWGAAFALGLGLTLLIPLVLIALARIEEIAAVAFGRAPRRLIASALPAPEGFAPKVSIHIPAYREPPEMLKATLDAVARLEYPSFECVVIINNTPDPAFWMPIEAHCRELGERFKFLRADEVKGFKAGALRLALEHTGPDAEVIGVLDADYVVRPDWLRDVMPAFADPHVGMVQAPQDHRDGERSVLHHAMNGEYAGFFDIGMVQRNEANAIIVHGTMCLIRRTALDAAGGWSSDTICEDTDLGLSILERGWQVHYTNKRYGHGLLPDTYEAYKKQRHRWAYGGFQIVKKHWRSLLPSARGLSREQKREFAIGWLNWLGAETIGVLVAILNLVWVPVVAFAGIAIPDTILTIPILAAFLVALAHFIALYRLRVAIPIGQMAGAAVAAMSVQWTVARAVGYGLWKEGLPFMRTAKGGTTRKGTDFPAFWEAVMAALLLIGAVIVVAKNPTRIVEINIFAAVLVVQSLPFLAAVAIALIEGSRLNEFAYWRTVEAKVTDKLPLPPATAAASAAVAVAEVVAEAPPAMPALQSEQHVETVQ